MILKNTRKSCTAILIFSFIISVFQCGKKQNTEQAVVARVGNSVITVSDFRRNYEFGLPNLKTGPDRKLSYLNYMIKERILALEGEKLGLDKSPRVKRLEKDLLDELLVEELFKKEVNEKIKISQQEIRDAITKSKVSWKLRYWVEPSRDYAERISKAMRERGYSAVVSDILKRNPEVQLKPENLETDYLTWLDVPPELLNAIKDLPRGEISDPIEMNGVYFVFQITDIRQKGITEDELLTKAPRFKKILYYRKLFAKAKKYVSDYMTPKNVVTKGKAFKLLADAMAEWKKKEKGKRKDFYQSVAAANKTEPSLLKLKQNLSETLVTFSGGAWTVEDFIRQFDAEAFVGKSKEKDHFRQELSQEIAIKVRNYFFVKEAKNKGLQKSPDVVKSLEEWRKKWVYEEMRKSSLSNLHITDGQAKSYFEKFKDKYKIRWDDKPTYNSFKNEAKRDAYLNYARLILQKKVDSLKTYFPVVINRAVLDTIKVTDSAKSHWMSLQVFKQSSNRLAVPIIDPAWEF